MPRLIDPQLAIDDVSRSAAEQMGIQEVDVQWRRFVEKEIAKGELSCDFHALFRSRLPFIRNDERRERDRMRASGRPGPIDQADPYHAHEAIAERERARDSEWRERKSTAARPDVKGLLETLGSKRVTIAQGGQP